MRVLRSPDARGPLLWCAALTAVVVLLWAMPHGTLFGSPAEYVPVHVALEFVALAVSVMVFALSWNLRDGAANARIMALGWSSLMVMLIGVAHALSWSGMPVWVTPSSPGKAINFWLVARLVGAVGLIAAAMLRNRHWPERAWFLGTAGCLAATALVWWVGLYRADSLPVMFVEGQGLTSTKVWLEYFLVALYVVAAVLLLRGAVAARHPDDMWLAAAAWTLALAELFFSRYASVSDMDNVTGHVYLAVAYVMVYRAVFAAGVREPYRQLADERTLFRSLIDALPDPMSLKDNDGRYVAFNRSFQSFVGRRADEISGHTMDQVLPAESAAQLRALDRQAMEGDEPVHAQVRVLDPVTGAMVDFDSVRIPHIDVLGRPQGLISLHRNITEQLQSNKRIEQLVNFDSLTGLPNEALLRDRVAQAIHRADRHPEYLALMILDLDDFKSINETLTHAAGDAALVEVASRLHRAMRDGDTLARLDGDCFAVVMQGVDERSASVIAQRVLDAVGQPFHIAGLELLITASAGIALFPADGRDYAALHQNAETAMHQAKLEAKGTVRFFARELQERAMARLQLIAALRRVTGAGELRLHYQPQVDLVTDEVVGLEALVRWQHPQLGLLLPSTFIPLAEETSLIMEIGEWVLDRAVQDAARWQASGVFDGAVSVNVSAVQLRQGDLIASVERALSAHGLRPGGLKLELTETVAMTDPRAALQVVERLQDMGVGFALDDFGTGYSSMEYLKHFAGVDVKIDRSFIADLPDDAGSAVIVRAIVSLAGSLSSPTCAEGVETAAQLAYVRAEGCRTAQGYLISEALPADRLEAFLTARSQSGREGRR